MKKIFILLCVVLASCSKPEEPVAVVAQTCVINKFLYIKQVTNSQVIINDWFTTWGAGAFYSNNCADNGKVFDKTITTSSTGITYTEYRLKKVN